MKQATVGLDGRMRGSGHTIQRLAQGLGLPVEPVAKPEIYLDNCEREWAADARRSWPSDRPVCVLSTGAVTDRCNLEKVDWAAVIGVLAREFTVVQAVVSEPAWPGVVACRDLSIRQYLALIAAADCFIGGTTGGSHVAAAFDVPCLVVAWQSLLDHLRFPVSGLSFDATFLYPQQWFIAAEELSPGRFREARLCELLGDMARCGRKGRPTTIGNYSRRPAGFAPATPRRATMMRNRLVRVP